MRPLRNVVADPGIRDVVELVPTEAHEVIETFAFHRADDRLGEVITPWVLGSDCEVVPEDSPVFKNRRKLKRIPRYPQVL